jgi:hypothetical protein
VWEGRSRKAPPYPDQRDCIRRAGTALREALAHTGPPDTTLFIGRCINAVIEGKTPEITIEEGRTLLASVDIGQVVGLRDRAILATLAYTACRAGRSPSSD